MWHLISGFQQKNDAEAMKCLLCSLADAGAIRLLLHFSAADDHKIALVALHVICLAAEVEELASRLNKLVR